MTIKLTKKANKATDRKTMFTAIYSLNKSFIGSITHTQTRSFYPFFQQFSDRKLADISMKKSEKNKENEARQSNELSM